MLPQDPIELKVKELLAKGEKTEAIKFLKESSGLNFQECKSYVENLENKQVKSSPATTSPPVVDKKLDTIARESMPTESTASLVLIKSFLEHNSNNLPPAKIDHVKEQLSLLPDYRLAKLTSLNIKSPHTIQTTSIFLGFLAIDRFQLNDIIGGVCKLSLVLLTARLFWITHIHGIDLMDISPDYWNLITNLEYIFLASTVVLYGYDIATSFRRTLKSNLKKVLSLSN
jgi:hypothetical protein